MLDKTFGAKLNETTSFDFKVPKRDYNYDMTVLAYDEQGRAGNVGASLFC